MYDVPTYTLFTLSLESSIKSMKCNSCMGSLMIAMSHAIFGTDFILFDLYSLHSMFRVFWRRIEIYILFRK